MLLANKVALTFLPCPVLITSVQYIFSAMVPFVLDTVGVVKSEPLLWSSVLVYWQVPMLFSVAIFANAKVLETANVETFIVFRNTTPCLVAIADFLFMDKALPSLRGWGSFLVMVASSAVYTATDDGFLLQSYLWVSLYMVVITVEMVAVKHVFNTVKMTTWGRVYYTNLLSLVFQPLFLLVTAEHRKWQMLYTGELALSFRGGMAVVLSCITGVAISFVGTGFRNEVSATVFTLCGVLNKMLTVSANYFMWSNHANHVGLIALACCLGGGVMYKPAGTREKGTVSDAIYRRLCGLPPAEQAPPPQGASPPLPSPPPPAAPDAREGAT